MMNPLNICHSTDQELDNIIKNCTIPDPTPGNRFESDRWSGYRDNLVWATAEKSCRNLYPEISGAKLTRLIELEGYSNTPAMRVAFTTVLAGKEAKLKLTLNFRLEND